jgi:hypothetical protein
VGEGRRIGKDRVGLDRVLLAVVGGSRKDTCAFERSVWVWVWVWGIRILHSYRAEVDIPVRISHGALVYLTVDDLGTCVSVDGRTQHRKEVTALGCVW